MHEAPLCTLAVLINPVHRGREKRLLDWLKSRGVVDEPTVFEWHAGREIETAGLIIQKLASLVVFEARKITQSNRELLALRTLNDNLQIGLLLSRVLSTGRDCNPSISPSQTNRSAVPRVPTFWPMLHSKGYRKSFQSPAQA